MIAGVAHLLVTGLLGLALLFIAAVFALGLFGLCIILRTTLGPKAPVTQSRWMHSGPCCPQCPTPSNGNCCCRAVFPSHAEARRD